MSVIGQAVSQAGSLIISGNADLIEIVSLSLGVTLSAMIIACVLGFPLGAVLAIARFPGRAALIISVNAMMGLPPVVIGLFLYLLLSASGPFGVLQLLYTPGAMILAQVILIVPIIAAITLQVIRDLHLEYDETLRAMGANKLQTISTVCYDARHSLLTAALAGFGRANAEVGAVMIVGGNIDHVTRMMTTAIALETSKGDLALALALGIVLMLIAILVNIGLWSLSSKADQYAHVR